MVSSSPRSSVGEPRGLPRKKGTSEFADGAIRATPAGTFADQICWEKQIVSVRSAAAATMLLVAIGPAAAADPAAQFLVKLFVTVCVPNLGQPTKVREWAKARHLGEVQNPSALSIFVGAGDKGAAWAIPAAEGNFALSIRGTTQACAVWAQAADAGELLIAFKQIIDGVKRPGIEITVDKDVVTSSPVGEAHAFVYNVTAPNAPTSFDFLLTVERTGGPFQASLQAAKASAHPNSVR